MLSPDDAPLLRDGDVTLRTPRPHDRDHTEAWIGRTVPDALTDGSAHWFATEYGGGFVGWLGLLRRNAHEAEVALSLHSDAADDQVLDRALALLLDWGFTDAGYTVVHWRTTVGDWASRRAAWRAGFSFGPTVPRVLEHRGQWHDAWTGWIHADDPREPSGRWLTVPVLETDRLRLRAWEEQDLPRIVEARSDPVSQRFAPVPQPYGEDRARRFLRLIAEDTSMGTRITWCVADRDNDLPLANVSLFDLDGRDETCGEIGYWSHPEARGRGVTAEAVRRAADWALAAESKGGFGLRRLMVMTASSNVASIKVAERAGFVAAGTERAAYVLGDGSFDDMRVLDRLRTDAEPHQRAMPHPVVGA